MQNKGILKLVFFLLLEIYSYQAAHGYFEQNQQQLASQSFEMFTSRGLRPWALRPGITRPSIAPRLYLASSARPRLSVPRPATKAWESTAVADTGAAEVNTSEGEKGSGHIGVEPNESILFFDSMYARSNPAANLRPTSN